MEVLFFKQNLSDYVSAFTIPSQSQKNEKMPQCNPHKKYEGLCEEKCPSVKYLDDSLGNSELGEKLSMIFILVVKYFLRGQIPGQSQQQRH